LVDEGRSLMEGPLNSPGNGPLEHDEKHHIAEGAEEEDLLWQPLKKEVNVIFIVEGVEHFENKG
jgi:hypothetical protein